MNDNHVGAIQCGRMIEVIVIGDNAQVWKRSGEAVKRRRSLIGNQVGPAPAAPGLQCQGRMTASFQFAEDATQEMGIPVVPVRSDGMGVEDDLHVIAARPALA
jgi:hypothetical protein